MKNGTLYMKIDKNSALSNKTVLLSDVGKLYSTDKKMLSEVKNIVIYRIKDNKEQKFVFSILKVVEYITDKYPDIEIVNLGEADFIVSYYPPKGKKLILEYAKTAFVSFAIFFGSAFTIMTFNEDASVKDVFDRTYTLVLGTEKTSGTILEIAYALGIPVGTIVFFNHFSKMKIDNDPTPLQIQMRTYEEDANTTIITNATREGNENDVS